MRADVMIRTLFSAALGMVLFMSPIQGQEHDHDHGERAEWSEEILELAALLPVQEGGRVKPLDTLAGFRLLKYNGKRVHKFEVDGEKVKLDRVAWVLDCLFYPEMAMHHETFRINNDGVLRNMGLTPGEEKGKAGRYSYEQLAPGRERLMELANQLGHRDSKTLDPVEGQLVKLATDMLEFERLLRTTDVARARLSTSDSKRLAELFGDEEPSISTVLSNVARLREHYQSLGELELEERQAEDAAVQRLTGELEIATDLRSGGLALFPPAAEDGEDAPWLTAPEIVSMAFDRQGENAPVRQIAMLAAMEKMVENPDDRAAFQRELEAWHDSAKSLAEARGEYSKIPLEVSFYKADYFTNALVFFLLGFVLMAVSWLVPNVWLRRGVWACVILGGGVLIAGITMRCIIRGRPPVSTLYETILFIAACAVLVTLFMEWVTRRGIALTMGAVIGAMGMFLAMRYELQEAKTVGDTMPSLVAVLDTNFWLSTHVTTVTLGYSAGLLAAAIAHVWIFGKIFGYRASDSAHYKTIARMVYGVICFGLLFSVVGTILGGIWANYSWGRFWGWDPKENGALLICIFELLILHARLGGYIKDFGLCVMSILNGMVVAFSWWHVNQLGVGLHSYGFTEGILLALTIFYVSQLLVVIGACTWKLAKRQGPAAAA